MRQVHQGTCENLRPGVSYSGSTCAWGAYSPSSILGTPTMKFQISLDNENLLVSLRKCGYAPEGRDPKTGELRFWKSVTGRRFPRFHLYAVQQDNEATLNLHLDQKAPSYQGSAAHSGEYEGPLVEQEMQRILNLI